MNSNHFTTRRAFVAACGFGAVGLYGAWAAYGAAPLPFATAADTPVPAAGGHGHGNGGMSEADFLREHESFLGRHTLEDGSVDPGQTQPDPVIADDHGHSAAEAPPADDHAGHGDASQSAEATADTHGHGDAPDIALADDHGGTENSAAVVPTDIYLLAYRFGFDPGHLRLKVGTPYRFRMMAQDLAHGASLKVGAGSRIIRLRPGVVSEQTITFQEVGDILVYCTVYCGSGHDMMASRITVA